MHENLCIVGVGSLGSHVAQKMQHYCDRIYAVDPDKVEERNLRNSIYTKADIDMPKVNALQKHISHCKVVPVQGRMEEIDIPHADTVIDCRDVVNRNIQSDVKFSVVGRHLRVDCEPIVKEADKPGTYLHELNKRKLSQAGELTTRLMRSDVIETIQDKHSLVYIPVNNWSMIKSISNSLIHPKSPQANLYDILESFNCRGLGGA